MGRVALVVFSLLLWISSGWSQQKGGPIPTVDPNCCGEKLMDSGGHVVVEPRFLLKDSQTVQQYRYKAARVKLCSTDPFYLQVWEMTDADNNLFKLTWQHYVAGVTAGFSNIIQFSPNNQAVLNERSRFGMYSASDLNKANKYPIPYVPNDSQGPNSNRILYRTAYALNATQEANMGVGNEMQLDNLPWPRIFSVNVQFCTDFDCTTTLPDQPDGSIQGPPGPPGPAGPPGECVVNDCSADIPEILGDLPDNVNRIQDGTNELKEDVDEVKQILNGLINSKTVSGTCPAGFSEGTIGVNGCYAIVRQKVPLAVAHVYCRSLFPGSILASIENQQTEILLRAEAINTRGGSATPDLVEDFWVRGIWSVYDKLWLWYDERTKTKTKMTGYNNWAENEVTDVERNRCLSFRVFFSNVTSLWYSEYCHSLRNFICEYPKKCL